MKEIEQRGKDKLLFECHCGGAHFIMFELIEWDGTKEFVISMVSPSHGLFYRIKKAISYIFTGGHLYYTEAGLNEDNLNKVVDLIYKYKELEFVKE